MTQVNIHEAKTHLSELLEKAMNGEEIVIAKAGEAMVRLVPVQQRNKSVFGMDEGKGWIAEDFDTLPDDLLAAFYGEDESEDR
jgi:prevent-host-death family protein